ncbi:peroxiredoxin-like family protein [Sphaerisporangium sp. NPDC004334]
MSRPANTRRVTPGMSITGRRLATVSGGPVAVPEAGRLTHLQFRRFAGCPVCNLHLRSVVARHDEILAAGIREVVVFHSSAEDLRPHVADLPFAVVPDLGKRLYAEFGVEAAPRSLLHPRALWAIIRGVLRDLGPVLLRRRPAPSLVPSGGNLGLPADLLIDGEGRVLAVKYGDHAYDQWPVDTLLALARAHSATSPSGARQNP